jgi:hypothetical protein
MMPNRSTRVLATLGVTVSLALTAIAGPALVSAAPAPLLIGRGAVIDSFPLSGAVPGTVSPGRNVAFKVWAKNNGSSTISKLFLTGTTAGDFVDYDLINSGTDGTCAQGPAGGADIQCSWLGVVPGATIQLTFIAKTPGSGTSMPVDFEWSTSGFVDVSKGKNKSHGDAFTLMDSVALNGNINLFDGGYFQTAALVATNPALSRQNPQSTAIPAILGADFESGPFTVEENPAPGACPQKVLDEGRSCFGQESIINANGGQVFDDGFEVQIGLDGTIAPGNIQTINFAHILDNGTVELIDTTCSDLTPEPAELAEGGCKVIEPLGGGDALGHIFVNENGRIRNF